MKKKEYSKPIVEETPLFPQSVICASITKGPDVPDGETIYGD
jgi:hypothetical protein